MEGGPGVGVDSQEHPGGQARSSTEAWSGGCWLLDVLERAQEGLGCIPLWRPHDPPSTPAPSPISTSSASCRALTQEGLLQPPHHILRRNISSNRALLVV